MSDVIDIVEPVEEPVIILETADQGAPGPRGDVGPQGDGVSTLDFLLDDDPVAQDVTLTIGRAGGQVTSVMWTDAATGHALKNLVIVRTAGAVTSLITQVLDPADGITIRAQKTDTITRAAGSVSSIATTRDI